MIDDPPKIGDPADDNETCVATSGETEKADAVPIDPRPVGPGSEHMVDQMFDGGWPLIAPSSAVFVRVRNRCDHEASIGERCGGVMMAAERPVEAVRDYDKG